jgi:GH24 family phage-related lysozyme (muramidase)
LVAAKDYEGIADQIERTKRLWENIDDIKVKRREEEADLIYNSLS